MSRCISYFRGMALVSLNILSWKEEICALKPPEQSFQVNTWRLPLTMMSIFTIHKTFCVQEISRTKVEEGVHNVGLGLQEVCIGLQAVSKSSSTKANSNAFLWGLRSRVGLELFQTLIMYMVYNVFSSNLSLILNLYQY